MFQLTVFGDGSLSPNHSSIDPIDFACIIQCYVNKFLIDTILNLLHLLLQSFQEMDRLELANKQRRFPSSHCCNYYFLLITFRWHSEICSQKTKNYNKEHQYTIFMNKLACIDRLHRVSCSIPKTPGSCLELRLC